MATVTGKVEKVVKARNSTNGNPRWKIVLDGKPYVTKPDSMFAYTIGAGWVGRTYRLELDTQDRIVDGKELTENAGCPKCGSHDYHSKDMAYGISWDCKSCGHHYYFSIGD